MRIWMGKKDGWCIKKSTDKKKCLASNSRHILQKKSLKIYTNNTQIYFDKSLLYTQWIYLEHLSKDW